MCATPQVPYAAVHDPPAHLSAVPRGLPARVQEFFREDMGLPLTMTPDYTDFSCQVRAKASWVAKMPVLAHAAEGRAASVQRVVAASAGWLYVSGRHAALGVPSRC